MSNLNLLFNKSYFSEFNDDEFKENNSEIINTTFSKPGRLYEELSKYCTHHFRMKTAYPGLLVGTGYAHEAFIPGDESSEGSNNTNCVKLGFSFDYVTGMPYIPGSSVKGMLRSCFKKEGVVSEILDKYKGPVSDLEKDIFENGKDIFFDAVIVKGNEQCLIVGKDYITPHTKGDTKEPHPLLMLKVVPDVVFEFRFRLNDYETEKGTKVSANDKAKLFMELLEIFGIGAKTNVGYGMLEKHVDG